MNKKDITMELSTGNDIQVLFFNSKLGHWHLRWPERDKSIL